MEVVTSTEVACAAAGTRRGETIIAVVDADADVADAAVAAASDDRVTQSAQVKRSKTGLRRGGGGGHECPKLRRSDSRRRVIGGGLAGAPRGPVAVRRRRPIDLLTILTLHTYTTHSVLRRVLLVAAVMQAAVSVMPGGRIGARWRWRHYIII